ncbi:MAG: UvrD-helicase domain-containing protein, partial [Verrucomicrobiales bacterium]
MSTVSLNSDFLDAMMRLPGPIQRKVRQFVSKFMADPSSPGLNYERIQQASDKNLRSVRIDQAYRAIVFRSPNEDAHVLMWVDHHDEAYDWAARRRVEVNPRRGSLQIVVPYETSEAPIEPAKTRISEQSPSFLDGVSRDDLLDCGIPEGALGALSLVKTAEDLDLIKDLLPLEAYEALSFLAAGIPMGEVKSTFAPPPIEVASIDPEDFKTALEHPDSQRRFAAVTSQKELEEILDAPLDKWRVFLHPSQRKVVERVYRGPAKILGGPGTGKTVVAMHRAKHLAERAGPGERVLFTTFTANLAENLEAIMKGFVGASAKERLDVVHLHSWLKRFMLSLSVGWKEPAEEAEIDEYWRQSSAATGIAEFPVPFLKREFRDVIVPG